MTDSMDAAPQLQEEPDHFGGCPFCGGSRGFLNIGSKHWFFCEEHATRWCAGENLFSSWRDENEEDWHWNAEQLEGYAEVKPLMPSWCRPVSREGFFEELRKDGWIPDCRGGWLNPKFANTEEDLLF
jgi:hypothetical protein